MGQHQQTHSVQGPGRTVSPRVTRRLPAPYGKGRRIGRSVPSHGISPIRVGKIGVPGSHLGRHGWHPLGIALHRALGRHSLGITLHRLLGRHSLGITLHRLLGRHSLGITLHRALGRHSLRIALHRALGRHSLGIALHRLLGRHSLGITLHRALGRHSLGIALHWLLRRHSLGIALHWLLRRHSLGIALYRALGRHSLGITLHRLLRRHSLGIALHRPLGRHHIGNSSRRRRRIPVGRRIRAVVHGIDLPYTIFLIITAGRVSERSLPDLPKKFLQSAAPGHRGSRRKASIGLYQTGTTGTTAGKSDAHRSIPAPAGL